MAHNSSSRDGCTCVACLCAALDPESAASSDAPLKDLLRAVRGMAADAVPPALREPTTLSTLLILAGAAESTLERLQGYNDAESGADAAARGTAPLHALPRLLPRALPRLRRLRPQLTARRALRRSRSGSHSISCTSSTFVCNLEA